jgi:hypothetical protein
MAVRTRSRADPGRTVRPSPLGLEFARTTALLALAILAIAVALPALLELAALAKPR